MKLPEQFSMNLLALIGNNVGRALETRFFAQAKTLGVPRIIGYALQVNVNQTNTDTPVTLFLLPGTNFTVTKLQVNNASVSLTTATASLYTATGGGGGSGTALAADQALSALTVVGVGNANLTLASAASNTVLNTTTLGLADTLYIRIGTAQGAAATADFYIWGECLP
jgi:hypothetical protein